MLIRQAILKDVNAILLFRETVLKESTYMNPTTVEKIIETINKFKHYYIAIDRDKIVGQIIADVKPNDGAYITHLAVLKSEYGKGTSSKLLDTLLTECKKINITKVQLIVDKNNTRAKAFYVKKGFKYIKLFKYGRPEEIFELVIIKSGLNNISKIKKEQNLINSW